jgi:hypothetical protein
MKFDELKLLVAIDSVKPKGDPVSDAKRRKCAIDVRDRYTLLTGDVLFPWTQSEVVELCVRYRKQLDVRTKAEIAAAHGCECFWRNRSKGPCCDDAEGGHIVPRAAGAELTVANGLIECRAHNNQRRERSIEEYLVSEDRTE